MKQYLFLILLLIGLDGCASARSTMLHRGEWDQSWEKERFLNGVPITLQVPTHLRVDIVEHRYLGLKNAARPTDFAAEIDWLNPTNAPERSVNTELIKTSKIFTVDPKRPAAGTIDATLKFAGANGQYLDQIDYKVEDKTLDAITNLIGKVGESGLFGTPTAEGGAETAQDVSQYLLRVDNVVASAMFNLDAPDLELQLAEFLETHLNSCHSCHELIE